MKDLNFIAPCDKEMAHLRLPLLEQSQRKPANVEVLIRSTLSKHNNQNVQISLENCEIVNQANSSNEKRQ